MAIARTHRAVSRLDPTPPTRYPHQSLIRGAPVLPLSAPVRTPMLCTGALNGAPGTTCASGAHLHPHRDSGHRASRVATAAARLLRPHTYATLFGLLYTTGLRCGEAFGLNLSDVDLEQNRLFITQGKFGKSRWVPISSSTADALRRYRHARLSIAPSLPDSPFFVIPTGRRLYHTNVDHAFRRVLKRCGLRGGKGCPGPRLHHLRHSFACTRLLLWYREDKDINALLPALATYLGHININSTQVYLRATTALLEQANQRFAAHFRHHILPNGD